MKKLGLLAAVLAAALPAGALSSPSAQQAIRSLRLEANRTAIANMTGTDEQAADAARKGFDGGALPVTVTVIHPEGEVPVPGAGAPVPASPASPAPADGKRPALGDSYHFEGRRSAMPGLTIYTPVKDPPGREGSTTSPGGGDWKQTAIKALPYVGAAATIGGFFFPPLLFLGGLLLGAWGAMKLLSRD